MMSKKNLEYWQKKLSNKLGVLELSTDKPRRANQDYDIGIETFIFPQSVYQSVKTLSNSCGSYDFTTLLTVFKCLLYRYTYQSEIVVGSYIPNSDNSDFNTVALSNLISGDILFSELLKQVNQAVNEDLQHQDFDWEQLVNKLNLQDTDIFQVMFSFQDAKTKNITLP
ncbi:MAG: condensation domain-containing protein, partial [Rivularia sp. ALOHA_DT_140]|nr:condensation domain-containing protein [Rivularia sp. ALOHA_DT_140]